MINKILAFRAGARPDDITYLNMHVINVELGTK